MKKLFLMAALAAATLTASAQGKNTGQGGYDGDYKSLAEKVAGLEKKTEAFQVYLNYAASYQEEKIDEDDWTGRFANKQLRLEIKGDIGEKISYRLRHRLNKSNVARGEDNFAKATDIMQFTYKFSPKFAITAGKHCQYWGGFEFDENPMYIYQFSDMVGEMDNYHAGLVFSYKPVADQELVLDVSNTNNDKVADYYGDDAVEGNMAGKRVLEDPTHPLTFILNWNGSLFDGLITTRWSYGLQSYAKQKYGRSWTFGQQLNLDNLQWYFDYYGTWDALDRLNIATGELGQVLGGIASDVHQNSFVTKMNWQFAPQWNLMLKGMYETCSVSKVEQFKDYRKAWGYVGSIEYYPVKDQDFRIFASYIGRKYDYSDKSGLADYNTNRIELGFMYRIKAF